ncbi:MAG: cytochrome P450 [Proteobacteria bacterium]|nr:cytochrome P450 [Pseudomonadota bacterium]
MSLSLESIDLVDADRFAARGYPHEEWAWLRRNAPLHRFEPRGIEPFWAVTRHADLIALSKQPKLFVNEPRVALADPERERTEPTQRNLLFMDPPEHAAYRRLVSSHFTPRSLGRLHRDVERISRELLDSVRTDGELVEIDFVERVAAILPLAVIARMLGLPRDDWEQLFEWTNESIGASDPEYRREGETSLETSERARIAMFEYFVALVEERRREPRDDIASVLARADLDGEPLPTFELLSYYLLLIVAGNETTRNATSGGLAALMDRPGELDKLRRDPSLIPSAVEEILRWTTPVIQFCRTATRDVELREQKIRAGESFALYYPSANRDEEVFDAPFEFRVDRRPNPHLAFGIGEHFCLGANLARMELRVIFRDLVERLEYVEPAGPIERLRSHFIGGVKHLPIRYRLR